MQRQLRRRRTGITLTFLALLPVLVWAAFALGGNDDDGSRLVDFATSSGLNFATFTLFASANFLLVVVVALFFGDTVASEASWSSLRYLLAAPIPRARLLRQKALVAASLSGIGLLLLALVALGIGIVVHGGGQLVSPGGQALDLLPGVVSFAGAVLYVAVNLTWVAGLATWLGVATDAPLGAVGGAVVVSIVSTILDQITALGALRSFLPTHYATAWRDLLSDEVDWANMINGTATSLAYATAFGVLAVLHFSRRDVTS
ncbi:ABC transporter permease subunit [Allosaccharopolyspora coralli]|uniref:ABC transporter permease subunit n=2 Tax=Allosaccharopolyspora coralli TaxID=2665642 RepID=A0A5Q3QLL2_9PSEU|nr:ABC transporter permease subunit [Allosaccharopolyspora coralli]